MTMKIIIAINDDVLDEIHVVNLGHPESHDHPTDDDLRRYGFHLPFDGWDPIEVEHRRNDGRFRLAEIVMAAIGECSAGGCLAPQGEEARALTRGQSARSITPTGTDAAKGHYD